MSQRPFDVQDALLVTPVEFAMIEAARNFVGRDPRRIKREIRKAVQKAKGKTGLIATRPVKIWMRRMSIEDVTNG